MTSLLFLASALAIAIVTGCGVMDPICPDTPEELLGVKPDYTVYSEPSRTDLVRCTMNRWGSAGGIRFARVSTTKATNIVVTAEAPDDPDRTGSINGSGWDEVTIMVDPGLSDYHWGQVLTHEFEHFLSRSNDHPEGGSVGVTGGKTGAKINSEDLSWVCAKAQCRWFKPER